jgi:hypothetical protein
MRWRQIWSAIMYGYLRRRMRPPNIHGEVELKLAGLDKAECLDHVRVVSAETTWDGKPVDGLGAVAASRVAPGYMDDVAHAVRIAVRSGKRARCLVRLRDDRRKGRENRLACLLEITRTRVAGTKCRAKIRIWHREPLVGHCPKWASKAGGACAASLGAYLCLLNIGVHHNEAVSGALLVMLAIFGAAQEALKHRAL